MRRTEQINAFWELTRERSADGEVVRRRAAAIGAIAIVFCGFLLAIGLGVVVLAFLAGALASIGMVAFVALWPRVRKTAAFRLGHIDENGRRLSALLAPRFRQLGAATARALGTGRTRTSRVARRASASGSRIGRKFGRIGRTHASAVARAAVASGSRLGASAGQSARATALRFAPRAARLNPQREAIRLNATGTQHRRHGRRQEGDNVLELALAKLSPASSAYQAVEAELRRAS